MNNIKDISTDPRLKLINTINPTKQQYLKQYKKTKLRVYKYPIY